MPSFFRQCWFAFVFVAAAVPAAVKAAEPRPSVYLHGARDFLLPDDRYPYQGLLARELVRQALLIAARDELGCNTHDLHLEQTPPAEAIHLDVVAIWGLDKPNAPPTRLELLIGAPPTQQLLAADEFVPPRPVQVLPLIKECEVRSRGSFVAHLKRAGLSGQPRTWNAAADVPADVQVWLSDMNFISQFRAAAALHAEIARQGHSAPLLAALVRAYANLGVLSELHWAPAHKVFTARSLLYAQRLVAQNRDFTCAFTARAYAYALAGLRQAALVDLDSLDQLAFQGRAKVDGLAVILRDFCRFRWELINPARFPEEHEGLVLLLRCLAREQGSGSKEAIEESLNALKIVPQCYRIQTSLCRYAGVSLGHSVTVAGPAMTARTLYERLIDIPDLPPAARTIAAAVMPPPLPLDQRGLPGIDFAVEFPARAKLIAVLTATTQHLGDQHELTWPVLGHLLAEHSFLEVFQRADFERHQLDVPCDDWLALAKPLYSRANAS